MKILCPVRKTVWGQIKSQKDLVYAITKSGQFFGVDESGPACNSVPGAPCNISYYQYLGFGLHKGIDIPVATGTEVLAAHDGVVKELSETVSKGLGVVLYDPAQKIKTVYWHHKENKVKVGQLVKAGDLIAISDNTGYSTGPHLHFELKITDEFGNSLNAIDPMPHFVWDTMSEQDVKNLYKLAFYRLPDATELSFWTGKDLSEFLIVAIKDRAEFLSG